jgi:hypothetical protein
MVWVLARLLYKDVDANKQKRGDIVLISRVSKEVTDIKIQLLLVQYGKPAVRNGKVSLNRGGQVYAACAEDVLDKCGQRGLSMAALITHAVVTRTSCPYQVALGQQGQVETARVSKMYQHSCLYLRSWRKGACLGAGRCFIITSNRLPVSWSVPWFRKAPRK